MLQIVVPFCASILYWVISSEGFFARRSVEDSNQCNGSGPIWRMNQKRQTLMCSHYSTICSNAQDFTIRRDCERGCRRDDTVSHQQRGLKTMHAISCAVREHCSEEPYIGNACLRTAEAWLILACPDTENENKKYARIQAGRGTVGRPNTQKEIDSLPHLGKPELVGMRKIEGLSRTELTRRAMKQARTKAAPSVHFIPSCAVSVQEGNQWEVGSAGWGDNCVDLRLVHTIDAVGPTCQTRHAIAQTGGKSTDLSCFRCPSVNSSTLGKSEVGRTGEKQCARCSVKRCCVQRASVPENLLCKKNCGNVVLDVCMKIRASGAGFPSNTHGKILQIDLAPAPGVSSEMPGLLSGNWKTQTCPVPSIELQEHVNSRHVRLIGLESQNVYESDIWWSYSTTIVELPPNGETSPSIVRRATVCKLILWRWYLLSTRVGEADNPGPDQPPGVCISAFNPTSVHQRSAHLSQCGDVVLLSETSATKQVQKNEKHALRALGVRSVWSPPVEPHKNSDESATSLRGASRGTACLSRYPIRETRDEFPAAWSETGRISECYVQIGAVQIRIITLYGFVKGTPNGLSMTNFLLEAATQRMLLNRTPTIIGGDLNRSVDSLKAWIPLRNKGFVEIHEFAASATTEPTCVSRKVDGPGTRHDTLLVDPRLVPFITHVRVDKEKAISVHRPVQAFFQLPSEQLKSTRWRLPKDFAGLGMSPAQLDTAYAEAQIKPSPRDEDNKCRPEALIEWTRNLEMIIDQTFTQMHSQDPVAFPFPRLPKSCKGRCVQKRAISLPIPAPCRQARHNDYQPPGEAVAIRSKLKIEEPVPA